MSKPKKTRPEDAEKLDAKPSYRCTSDEFEATCKEARRRGMTFSQLVRLAVNSEVKRGGK